jgi:potassium intermediate/small conductance calcium-activated channel subfamily N protein 2
MSQGIESKSATSASNHAKPPDNLVTDDAVASHLNIDQSPFQTERSLIQHSIHSERSVRSNKAKKPALVRQQTDRKDSLIVLQSEDSAQTIIEYDKLKVAEYSCLTLALFGFACGAISADLTFTDEQRDSNGTKLKILMHLCSVSTGLLLIAVAWRTRQELKWQQAKAIYSYQDDLFSTGKYVALAFELVFCIVHPAFGSQDVDVPHYVNHYDVTIHYQLNSILTIAMLARLYHPIRLLSALSDFRSCRAQRICQMNGCRNGTFFAVKCLIRDKPNEVICSMLALGIFTGAYCFRTFERPLVLYSGFQFQDYGSCMWCVIITMTTVGYGDMFPATIPGRFFCFIICIWGVLVVSMMVVAVNNMVQLELGEDKAYLVLRRLRFREELRDAAAYVLTSALHYKYTLRHGLGSKRQFELQLSRFRKHINNFQLLRLQQRSLYDYDSPEDRLESKIDEVIESNELIKSELTAIKSALTGSK